MTDNEAPAIELPKQEPAPVDKREIGQLFIVESRGNRFLGQAVGVLVRPVRLEEVWSLAELRTPVTAPDGSVLGYRIEPQLFSPLIGDRKAAPDVEIDAPESITRVPETSVLRAVYIATLARSEMTAEQLQAEQREREAREHGRLKIAPAGALNHPSVRGNLPRRGTER